MFRRRKRKHASIDDSLPIPSNPVPHSVSSSPVSGALHPDFKPSRALSDSFKNAVEKALNWPVTELALKGKVKPKAIFVYPDGAVKGVSLSFKDEFHRESLKHRIREKALAENALAVIILSSKDNDENTMVLSGASLGMRASAYVEFTLDEESKTLISREIHWMNQPLQDDFIDGIFDENP